MKKSIVLLLFLAGIIGTGTGQQSVPIPKLLSNIKYDSHGKLEYTYPKTGAKVYLESSTSFYCTDSI